MTWLAIGHVSTSIWGIYIYIYIYIKVTPALSNLLSLS